MKNQIWSRSKIVWGRYLAVFLLIPFLLFSFGAAAKRSVPAKRSAAQKAKPRLKPVPWLWQGGTNKSYMAGIKGQIDELQSRKQSLIAQIAQTASGATADEISMEQSASDGTATTVQDDQKLKAFSAGMNSDQTTTGGSSSGMSSGQTTAGASSSGMSSGQTTTGGASSGMRFGQTTTGSTAGRAPTTALLRQQEAELAKTQILLDQYKSAAGQMQAATLGKEANYKALVEGRLKDSGGFYAQRVVLDQSGGAQIIPSGNCGDYPREWCAAPPDSLITFCGSRFLNRECVAYAAWKRCTNGKSYGVSDAGDWPGNSGRATVGSAAVWNRSAGSPYGHVAYVTAVGSDSITISEFNWHPFLYTSRVLKVGRPGFPHRFLN